VDAWFAPVAQYVVGQAGVPQAPGGRTGRSPGSGWERLMDSRRRQRRRSYEALLVHQMWPVRCSLARVGVHARPCTLHARFAATGPSAAEQAAISGGGSGGDWSSGCAHRGAQAIIGA
jgi:hypothetical protein